MKNPKRVAAGRANRLKRGELSESGRQRLSEATRTHRPWKEATGPKTKSGKARSATNGIKTKSAMREMEMLVFMQLRSLRQLRAKLAERMSQANVP